MAFHFRMMMLKVFHAVLCGSRQEWEVLVIIAGRNDNSKNALFFQVTLFPLDFGAEKSKIVCNYRLERWQSGRMRGFAKPVSL